jgi:Uncharacterized protein conserved in bacteria (DUF2252)
MDLVRLASSALLAAREDKLSIKPKDCCEAMLEAYRRGIQEGGRPIVLEEEHAWLRTIALNELRDPVTFWEKMKQLPTARGDVPESAREAIEHLLPEPGMVYRLAPRIAGLGSLGRVRLVAISPWRGGLLAREAKALAPSAAHWADSKAPREILYGVILKKAVRCPDPFVQLRGHWIVRRLSPHCSRIELDDLGTARAELRLMEAMGYETANIHAGTKEKRESILKDLRKKNAKWLVKSAGAMADEIEKDWQAWKERWQSRFAS